MKNKSRFSNAWMPIGPEWKTTDVFQIRELLRGEQIAFKMPFSDLFFTSIFHLPAEDKRWNILIRRTDRERTVALLAQEGLVSKEMLLKDNRKIITSKPEEDYSASDQPTCAGAFSYQRMSAR